MSVLGVPTCAYPGINATKHLLHYFDNTGLPYTIDLEGMVKDVPSAKDAMVGEFHRAQHFLAKLPPGTYDFTSRAAHGATSFESESADWFFATGSYTFWGKGTARITMAGGQRHYDVAFEYRFYDRYNWDRGKAVSIGGMTITDKFMGEYHREGLAKEYDCFGGLKRSLSWTGDVAVPRDQAIFARAGR